MKAVRNRVKTAFKRNSKSVDALLSASVQLPQASTSTPSVLIPKEKPDGPRSLPTSPLIKPERGPSYPDFRVEAEPISDPPVMPTYQNDKREHEDGPFFTNDLEEVSAGRPIPITIVDNSRRSTPKKRIKSVPRTSSDSYFPSPSIESRILTTLPDGDEHVKGDIKFVSPVDPNYLIEDHLVSEPSLLEQPQPIDPAYVEFTPKHVVSEVPSFHEILLQHTQLSSNNDTNRAPSPDNTIEEEKPLLDSLSMTEVDEILDSVWPLPPPTYPSLGWTEHILPSSAYYYSHVATRTVTDIDLRNQKKLSAVTKYLKDRHSPKPEKVDLKKKKKRDSDTIRHIRFESTSQIEEGVDLWLRDANPGLLTNDPGWELMPMRNWVLHASRAVIFHSPTDKDYSPEDLSDEDRLDLENRYWQYISTHPAHVTLPQSAYDEALDVLAWCYADRVLFPPQPLAVPSPFSQKECSTLLELIRSLSAASTPTSSQIVRTRLVAQILLRYTEWRQKYIIKSTTSAKILHTLSGERPTTTRIEDAVPFRRTFLRFLKTIVCLGIPYIFELQEAAEKRSDEEELEESRTRTCATSDPTLGASQPIIAALLLSASVTLLTLPDINRSARVSALISALCAVSSLVSYIITLYGRYHRRSAVSRNSDMRVILASLPLSLLAYSTGAFIIGVIAYAIGSSEVGRSQGFGRYTAWTIIGVWIALVAILAGSAILTKKGI